MAYLSDELSHAGVKGMKWGVRKKLAPGYSPLQAKRDAQIYGNRGAGRINKNMKKGDNISTARGSEKTRRDRVMGRNKYVRQGGKIAGAVGGVVISNVAISSLKTIAYSPKTLSLVGRILKNASPKVKVGAANAMVGVRTASEFLSMPQIRLITSVGAAKVGNMLAGDMAVSANMRLNGYDPSRK